MRADYIVNIRLTCNISPVLSMPDDNVCFQWTHKTSPYHDCRLLLVGREKTVFLELLVWRTGDVYLIIRTHADIRLVGPEDLHPIHCIPAGMLQGKIEAFLSICFVYKRLADCSAS